MSLPSGSLVPTYAMVKAGDNIFSSTGVAVTTAVNASQQEAGSYQTSAIATGATYNIFTGAMADDGYYYGSIEFSLWLEGTVVGNGDVSGVQATENAVTSFSFTQDY